MNKECLVYDIIVIEDITYLYRVNVRLNYLALSISSDSYCNLN